MNKTALITGASKGIGKACALKFNECGYKVLAPTRQEMDLSSEDSIFQYIEGIKEPVHVLVNNGGINPLGNIGELNFNDARLLMNVNFWAPVILTNLLAPMMKEAGYGRIVNISSIWSSVSKKGRAIYASSKAAINAFTRTTAIEYSEYNVLVNAVAPGFINTELTKINNSPEQIERIKSNLPVRRLAETEEVAELIFFLASEKNTFTTGQTIFTDGGYTIL